MVSVEHLIGELLLRHSCVIIPSFGGFVAKQTSATIDYKNGVMSPPRKSLLFNRQLINNDGLLIAELAVSNSIHYNEANETINALIEIWNDKLKRGERITIDKVGFLFFDQEKNICFEQDRFFNLLLESYGLDKVHFLSETDVQFAQKTTIERSINKEDDTAQPVIVFDTEAIKVETNNSDKKIIPHPALQSKTKVWKYIAAACLLPIAFYSFWLPMKTDVLESGMISIKDFNPFYQSNKGVYTSTELDSFEFPAKEKSLEENVAELPEDIRVYPYPYDDLNILVRVPEKLKHPVEINTVKESPKSTTIPQSKFEYIVGCFGSETNANNLVETLKSKGIDAYILDVSNGLSRISAGSAVTDSELQNLIGEVKSAGFEGWILKK